MKQKNELNTKEVMFHAAQVKAVNHDLYSEHLNLNQGSNVSKFLESGGFEKYQCL